MTLSRYDAFGEWGQTYGGMMRRMNSSWARVFSASVFFVWLPCFAYAQVPIDLSLILSPKVNDFTFFGEVATNQYPTKGVKGQSSKIDLSEYRLTIAYQLWNSDSEEWFLLANYHRMELNTNAILPDGAPVPDNLENFNVGLGYRRIYESGALFGSMLQFGSASDQPFDSADEVYVIGNVFVEIPYKEDDGWLFALNINSNRFIPVLPGVAYHRRQPKYDVVLGIPFVDARFHPTEKLSIKASYVPINAVYTELAYVVAKNTSVFTAFEWREFFFTRADRLDDDAFIEYDEKRLVTGIRFILPNVGRFTLSGGYAFDRTIGEGDDISSREDNEIEIGDALFANIVYQVGF